METSAGFPRRVHHRLHANVYMGGLWYVTICSHLRREIFSVVDGGEIYHLPIGRIITQEWLAVPQKRPGVILDEWVIMPNHLHAVLYIPCPNPAPAEGVRFARSRRSLGSLVAGFKSAVTSRVREMHHHPTFKVWQDGFWDHGVRDDQDLERIREYIRNNPAKWDEDPENRRNG